MIWICKTCNKEFKTRALLRKHRKETFCGNKVSWNKGLTKETDERIRKISLKCSKTLKGRSTHKQSEESRKKISETMKKNPNAGGYRIGSGRGKKDGMMEYSLIVNGNLDFGYIVKNTT